MAIWVLTCAPLPVKLAMTKRPNAALVQLLRMRRDTLEPRLRQQIRILKSKDIPVNWHQLIRDVGHWDHPEHFVQRNWARSFWGAGQAESKSE